MDNKYENALKANQIVHASMADEYDKIEPHFRPESIERVNRILDKEVFDKGEIGNVLDLGCGTGFMINIIKNKVNYIKGVDITQEMLDRVNLEGKAKIELVNHDTGSVELESDYFDLVTAYTFLDHLYDMRPTIENAFKAMKSGGVFYADLSPNYYFWDGIKALDHDRKYEHILEREIKAVRHKAEEIEQDFGIEQNYFIEAEHQKHVLGGLKEESLEALLKDIGFTHIKFVYHWFIGQAQLVNDPSRPKEENLRLAQVMHDNLSLSLPFSRRMFKYVGFLAYKS